MSSQTANGGRPQPEQFRHYLKMLARLQLGRSPHAKLDASDLVQQTLLDAHQDLQRFRGSSEAEMAGWLRRLLTCNLADALRHLGRAKRDINREQSLHEQLDCSAFQLGASLAAVQTSPSQHAARNEELLRLAWAMEQLPEAQRMAVELHHLRGRTLAETAIQLGRSEAAVAGLLRRGFRRLRQLLSEPTSGAVDGCSPNPYPREQL